VREFAAYPALARVAAFGLPHRSLSQFWWCVTGTSQTGPSLQHVTLHIEVQHPRKDMCLDAILSPLGNGMLVNPGDSSRFSSDNVLRKCEVAKCGSLPLARTQHPLQKLCECTSFGAI
jgi:hypothetical protein